MRKEAQALTAAGYRVAVISPAQSGRPRHELIDGVSVYRFPMWVFPIGSLGYLVEYCYAMLAIAALSLWVLLREGFDVVHAANPPDCIVPMISVYKLIGKLIIYDQHDLGPELYAAKFVESRCLSRLLLLMEWCSYQLADHVIVTNESYKEQAKQRGFLSESKITVARNGPDCRKLNATAIDPELRSKASNIIAYAGVIGFQDGLDCLCRALHALRYELHQEDFYCVVLGDGDALASIKSLARELRLDDKVWFAGWVSDPDDYARYISTADICVAPDPFNSYNDQSTFVKVMEYMAAAKPIVGFDLRETRRSAQDAALYVRSGDVQDFAEKLATLMRNPSLRDSLGISGYRRIQNELAWRYSVPKLLNAYAKVVESHFRDARGAFLEKGNDEEQSFASLPSAAPEKDLELRKW